MISPLRTKIAITPIGLQVQKNSACRQNLRNKRWAQATNMDGPIPTLMTRLRLIMTRPVMGTTKIRMHARRLPYQSPLAQLPFQKCCFTVLFQLLPSLLSFSQLASSARASLTKLRSSSLSQVLDFFLQELLEVWQKLESQRWHHTATSY